MKNYPNLIVTLETSLMPSMDTGLIVELLACVFRETTFYLLFDDESLIMFNHLGKAIRIFKGRVFNLHSGQGGLFISVRPKIKENRIKDLEDGGVQTAENSSSGWEFASNNKQLIDDPGNATSTHKVYSMCTSTAVRRRKHKIKNKSECKYCKGTQHNLPHCKDPITLLESSHNEIFENDGIRQSSDPRIDPKFDEQRYSNNNSRHKWHDSTDNPDPNRNQRTAGTQNPSRSLNNWQNQSMLDKTNESEASNRNVINECSPNPNRSRSRTNKDNDNSQKTPGCTKTAIFDCVISGRLINDICEPVSTNPNASSVVQLRDQCKLSTQHEQNRKDDPGRLTNDICEPVSTNLNTSSEVQLRHQCTLSRQHEQNRKGYSGRLTNDICEPASTNVNQCTLSTQHEQNRKDDSGRLTNDICAPVSTNPNTSSGVQLRHQCKSTQHEQDLHDQSLHELHTNKSCSSSAETFKPKTNPNGPIKTSKNPHVTYFTDYLMNIIEEHPDLIVISAFQNGHLYSQNGQTFIEMNGTKMACDRSKFDLLPDRITVCSESIYTVNGLVDKKITNYDYRKMRNLGTLGEYKPGILQSFKASPMAIPHVVITGKKDPYVCVKAEIGHFTKVFVYSGTEIVFENVLKTQNGSYFFTDDFFIVAGSTLTVYPLSDFQNFWVFESDLSSSPIIGEGLLSPLISNCFAAFDTVGNNLKFYHVDGNKRSITEMGALENIVQIGGCFASYGHYVDSGDNVHLYYFAPD